MTWFANLSPGCFKNFFFLNVLSKDGCPVWGSRRGFPVHNVSLVNTMERKGAPYSHGLLTLEWARLELGPQEQAPRSEAHLAGV